MNGDPEETESMAKATLARWEACQAADAYFKALDAQAAIEWDGKSVASTEEIEKLYWNAREKIARVCHSLGSPKLATCACGHGRSNHERDTVYGKCCSATCSCNLFQGGSSQ